MFTKENIRTVTVEIRLPVLKTDSIEEIFGDIPLKTFFPQSQSNRLLFNLLEKGIPIVTLDRGSTTLNVFKDRIAVRMRSAGDSKESQLLSPQLRTNPFTQESFAKTSSEVNYILGRALGKKAEKSKITANLTLVTQVRSPSPNFDRLLSMPPDKSGFKSGRLLSLTFQYQDTMFNEETLSRVSFGVTTRDGKNESLYARLRLETATGGPIDLDRICNELIEKTNGAYQMLGV